MTIKGLMDRLALTLAIFILSNSAAWSAFF